MFEFLETAKEGNAENLEVKGIQVFSGVHGPLALVAVTKISSTSSFTSKASAKPKHEKSPFPTAHLSY